jgi:hypothetical protein
MTWSKSASVADSKQRGIKQEIERMSMSNSEFDKITEMVLLTPKQLALFLTLEGGFKACSSQDLGIPWHSLAGAPPSIRALKAIGLLEVRPSRHVALALGWEKYLAGLLDGRGIPLKGRKLAVARGTLGVTLTEEGGVGFREVA